ncbi:MAG: electron transfer flavoprotein subunit alpha/FixB family protein, partial [Candidatus Heimdallarchaeota archaeon]|nr:electron transfer flavoprotein subunit alpha/FixB family protein [Candidatus Heimdallarchaeota archaeon]
QTNGEQLTDAALEILGEANRVKEKLDADSRKITAIVVGKNASKHTKTLIHHGADVVYVIEDDRLDDYQTLIYTRAILDALEEIKPEIMIFTASTLGRDLAPRVAAILSVGLSADCTEFDVGYYANKRKNQRFAKAFKMIRPSFGESKLATIIGPWTYPQMATARPGVFRSLKADKTRQGEVIQFSPNWSEDDFKIEVLETTRSADTIDLSKVEIIISGGFGVGKEGFTLLQELVDAINDNDQKAELGASRAAVDAGFIPYKYQVGQTGKTVRPQIYLAVGISGAIQHQAGMKESQTIIAINNDPSANIWDLADYGMVADYQEAIPALIDEVKAGYKFPLQ